MGGRSEEGSQSYQGYSNRSVLPLYTGENHEPLQHAQQRVEKYISGEVASLHSVEPITMGGLFMVQLMLRTPLLFFVCVVGGFSCPDHILGGIAAYRVL